MHRGELFFKGPAPHPLRSATLPTTLPPTPLVHIIEVEYLCPEKGNNNTGWRTGFIAAATYIYMCVCVWVWVDGGEDKMQRIFWSAGQPLFVYIKFECPTGNAVAVAAAGMV